MIPHFKIWSIIPSNTRRFYFLSTNKTKRLRCTTVHSSLAATKDIIIRQEITLRDIMTTLSNLTGYDRANNFPFVSQQKRAFETKNCQHDHISASNANGNANPFPWTCTEKTRFLFPFTLNGI